MDFFDNAVSKAKEALDIACKKTEEVVSIQKQRYDIAAAQNKLDKDFERLGKLYFEALQDSEPENEELKTLVLEIREKLARIKDLKDDINTAKNKRNCPKCNATVDKDAQFCSVCGASLNVDGE